MAELVLAPDVQWNGPTAAVALDAADHLSMTHQVGMFSWREISSKSYFAQKNVPSFLEV